MSAIAGILFFDEAPVEPGSIEKLTGAMKSRGSDEQTHWMQGSMALGHCMLRTTPESLEEHQPLMSQDKKLVMVWDGRLDNREELQRDFISAGVTLRDNSDAELALQSYALWGEECPKKLLGDFAFAVWDANKNNLFCVRDHMGARPFYYTRNDRYFAFASEDEALLKLPGVSHQPNEERIAYFLVPDFQDFDPAHSWLEDVWALMPAHSLQIASAGAVQKNRYWQLEPGEEASYASDEECQQAFLQVFGEAVRCRMRSIGNVSSMMSGGLDSASISAMVKRLLPEMPGKAFHTYSAISDHPETCVESQCIQSLTEDLGDNAHFVSVPSFTGMCNVQDLIDIAWPKAHPVDNSILLPAMMCLATGRDGHRVMLHGVSGDLAMHVPLRYPAHLMRDGQWLRAWRECREASRNNAYLRGHSPVLLYLLNFWTAYVPGRLKKFARAPLRWKQGSPLERSTINPEFAAKVGLFSRLNIQASKSRLIGNIRDEYAQMINSPFSNITLGLTIYERAAGHYGVELRDPWADRRVIGFFLALPLRYKVRNGWFKYLARTAFALDLEHEVRWRLGKEHLGWNFAHRLMDETHAFVSNTFEQDFGTVDKYVDMKAARRRCMAYCKAKWGDEQQSVYDIITLVLWSKRISC